MNTSKIEKHGKIFMLAYDQGFEHGPTDFNDYNYHPNFILKTALNGDASCFAMHYGMAKQCYSKAMRSQIPLILKLNGKTNLYSKNNKSAIVASVDDAKSLGAAGIGFTIYPGEDHEHEAYQQFAEIRREAERAGLITIIWSYARGPEIEEGPDAKGKDQYDKEVVAYAARVAAELGADVVKVKYTGDPKTFNWVVKSAVNTKVIASGTSNFSDNYLAEVDKLMTSGAHGLAVGRKIWQAEDPSGLAKKVAAKIYNS